MVVDSVNHLQILLWQLVVGIDELNHQVLLHGIEDARLEIVEIDESPLGIGVVGVAVAHRRIVQ